MRSSLKVPLSSEGGRLKLRHCERAHQFTHVVSSSHQWMHRCHGQSVKANNHILKFSSKVSDKTLSFTTALARYGTLAFSKGEIIWDIFFFFRTQKQVSFASYITPLYNAWPQMANDNQSANKSSPSMSRQPRDQRIQPTLRHLRPSSPTNCPPSMPWHLEPS